MKTELYLIRIRYQKIIGPFTKKGLRDAHRGFEFGLQDEVCGKRGKWVSLDDIDKIGREYPELSNFVQNELLSGWAISDRKYALSPQKPNGQRARGQTAKRKSFGLIATIAAVVFSFSSIYVIKKNEIVNRFLAQKTDPRPEKAKELYEKTGTASFMAYMESYRNEILKNGNPKDWIPYLRAFAFERNGEIAGLNAKVLRGSAATIAPQDCSLTFWDNTLRRKSSKIGKILSSEKVSKDELLKILLWDPDWILRRSPYESWIGPKSYFEACIRMCFKALKQGALKPDQDYTELISARISWMLAKLDQREEAQAELPSGPLGSLICIERAQSPEELSMCEFQEYSKEWQNFFKKRVALRESWLLIGKLSPLEEAEVQRITDLLPAIRPLDGITRMDFAPELRFLQEISLNGGRVDEASQFILTRYPEIKIIP